MAKLNHLVMKSFKTVRRSDVTKIVNDGNFFCILFDKHLNFYSLGENEEQNRYPGQ